MIFYFHKDKKKTKGKRRKTKDFFAMSCELRVVSSFAKSSRLDAHRQLR